MSRMNEVGKHRTTICTDPMTSVTYHSTAVVQFSPSAVILNSGGWRTATTKRRMNQAAQQFGLGYAVFQKAGEWFVTTGKKTVNFVDGMQISRI